MQGPQGDPGEDGQPGHDGKDGHNGKNGMKGARVGGLPFAVTRCVDSRNNSITRIVRRDDSAGSAFRTPLNTTGQIRSRNVSAVIPPMADSNAHHCGRLCSPCQKCSVLWKIFTARMQAYPHFQRDRTDICCTPTGLSDYILQGTLEIPDLQAQRDRRGTEAKPVPKVVLAHREQMVMVWAFRVPKEMQDRQERREKGAPQEIQGLLERMGKAEHQVSKNQLEMTCELSRDRVSGDDELA